MAVYTTVAEVATAMSRQFSDNTTPSEAAVRSFILLTSGEIEGEVLRNYCLPITPADNPISYEILTLANLYGAAAMAQDVISEGLGEKTKVSMWRTEYEKLLKKIKTVRCLADADLIEINRNRFGADDKDDGGGGGGRPTTPLPVGVAWSTDDTIDDAEIAALGTSHSHSIQIPALPQGAAHARLILWTADDEGTLMGVTVTMQFGDQLNLFDNANAEARTVEGHVGMARITVNPLGAAYAGQMLTVSF